MKIIFDVGSCRECPFSVIDKDGDFSCKLTKNKLNKLTWIGKDCPIGEGDEINCPECCMTAWKHFIEFMSKP